jgi:hypothetical protein
MRRLALLLCIVGMLVAPLAYSQQDPRPELPKILLAGFDSYRAAGPDEAMRVWLRNSPLEGTADAGTQEQILHAAGGRFGPWRAFDVIGARQISPSTRVVYLTLDYDRGPLFAKFVLYRTTQGYIVTSMVFSPNDTEVLPAQPL